MMVFFYLSTTVRPPGCGDPGIPTNGRRFGDNFTVGAVVFFRCDDDFDLIGSKFRVCQGNGLWSGVQPTCQPFNGKQQYALCHSTKTPHCVHIQAYQCKQMMILWSFETFPCRHML